jgi:hypothetical protein
MQLSLFINTAERKLVKSATSDFPINLPTMFREDTLRLVITLLEPTGLFTAPVQTFDISDIDLKVGIGVIGSDPEVFQDTWTKDTTARTFTADVVLNTTELNAAFAAGGDTLARTLEVEVERSSKFHTVLHEAVTLSKDIIINSLVAPVDVTTGSAFAASFAATTQNSETVEWATSGDYNIAHFKGMSGAALSGNGGKVVKVNSSANGFELSAPGGHTNKTDATSAPTTGNDLGDGYSVGSFWIDVTNDKAYVLVDSTNSAAVWKETSPTSPTHTHALDDLTDVDVTTSAPSDGDVLSYSLSGTEWIPVTGTSPNLWLTVTGDSGTASANTTTDSLQIAGGDGINTTVSGDILTVAGEEATSSNKGIASFGAHFAVVSGNVSLATVSLASGGTGATTAQDSFDNLSPLTTSGDLLTHDGSDNTRLAIATAGDTLTVDSGALDVGWRRNNLAATIAPTAGNDSGESYEVGSRWVDLTADREYVCVDASTSAAVWEKTAGGNKLDATGAPTAGNDLGDGYSVGSRWIDVTANKEYVCVDSTNSAAIWTETTAGATSVLAFKTIVVSGQSDVVADSATDSLTLVAGTNCTLTTDAAADSVTITTADTNSTYTAGDGLDLTGSSFSTDLKSAGGLAIDSTELALDVHGLADVGTTTFGATTFGAGDYVAVADASASNAPKKVKFPVELVMAASDETTDLTTGTAKLTFRMPHAMTLTDVRASVNTAPAGSTIIVDINEGGSTILSTKLSIDASEKTSTSAAAAAVISDGTLADDSEITIDIDQIGSSTAGKGLKVALIGYR